MARLVQLVAALLFVGFTAGAFALAAEEHCAPVCERDNGLPCCPEVCACCVHHVQVRAPEPGHALQPAASITSSPLLGVDDDAPPSPDPPGLLHVPKAA